jgi:tRNA 2-thiocytidine biosynthesis protein TtcA
MPPKLLTDDKRHIVIRPMVYCQERDISAYAKLLQFPIIPCNLCGSQDNLKRVLVKKLIAELGQDNRNVPSNILHALQAIRPSQLMDKKHWDFANLEKQRCVDLPVGEEIEVTLDPEIENQAEDL